MRLSFIGIVLVSLAFAAWALPWTPIGMGTDDYDTVTVIMLILAAVSSFTLQAFIFVWAPQFHLDPLLEFLWVLMGAHQFIRRPRQFYSRLAAECRRGRSDRRIMFSLLIVEVPGMGEAPSEKREPMEQSQPLASLLVRDTVRAQDVVAVSWPQEVWVLAVSAGRDARVGITQRLARAIAASEPPLGAREACRIGGSTFGLDGEDPDTLFSVARERLAPLSELVEVASAA